MFKSLPHNPAKRPLKKKPSENNVGKGKNAGNQYFILFPQCFLPFKKEKSNFKWHLICRLLMLSIWASLKTCRLVKSLGHQCHLTKPSTGFSTSQLLKETKVILGCYVLTLFHTIL